MAPQKTHTASTLRSMMLPASTEMAAAVAFVDGELASHLGGDDHPPQVVDPANHSGGHRLTPSRLGRPSGPDEGAFPPERIAKQDKEAPPLQNRFRGGA